MSNNYGVSTNPKLLQNIALAAVVVFALVMSYMIHITQKTVAGVMTDYDRTIEMALGDDAPSATPVATSSTEQ